MTPKRSKTSFAGDSLGFSASYRTTTNWVSCCFTSGAGKTVESMATQFLHQLAAKSISKGLFWVLASFKAATSEVLAAATSEIDPGGAFLDARSSESDWNTLKA